MDWQCRNGWIIPTFKSPQYGDHHPIVAWGSPPQKKAVSREVASHTWHTCFPDTKRKCLLMCIQHLLTDQLPEWATRFQHFLESSEEMGLRWLNPPWSAISSHSWADVSVQILQGWPASKLSESWTAQWKNTELDIKWPEFWSKVCKFLDCVYFCMCLFPHLEIEVFGSRALLRWPFNSQVFLIWLLHSPVLGIVGNHLNIQHDFSP